MSNNVFPSNLPGIGYTVLKSPENSVIIQQSPSFNECRINQSHNPIWRFELIYDFLRDQLGRSVGPTYTDLQVMMGFFLQQGMNFDSFLFTDPDDYTVNNQSLVLVNDGAVSPTYYTPIQRLMGGLFYEDVTDVNPLNGSGMVIKANGVTTTSFNFLGPGLTIPGYSFIGMYLKWLSPPTAPITGTFNFYFRVRFENPKQAFEKWANKWWSMGGDQGSKSDAVKLITARPPGV
jgi:hypothetical protein